MILLYLSLTIKEYHHYLDKTDMNDEFSRLSLLTGNKLLHGLLQNEYNIPTKPSRKREFLTVQGDLAAQVIIGFSH